MSDMRPLSNAVPGALPALLKEAPLSPGKVNFTWRVAVGPALERVTSVRLDGRTLVVEADSAQWAHEVRRLSSVILDRMQALLGAAAIDAITVRTFRA